MLITIYGTRGSYPVCSVNMLKYGGNTTCLFVQEKNDQIIVDGGSGIANLGYELTKNHNLFDNVINVLLTHTHWDHIMGFPFFQPFYIPDYNINIYGADSETMLLNEVFTRQQTKENFPIPFDRILAKLTFNSLIGEDEITFSNVKVKTIQLNHPGYVLGYRIEAESGIFVVLTDLADIHNNYLGMGMKEKASTDAEKFEQEYYNGLLKFIEGADLVYMDTNFTEEEVVNKRHWGHSTQLDALKLVAKVNPSPAIILGHHDPFHTDRDVDEIYSSARKIGKKMNNIEVFVAKEGGKFFL